tara:strand:+ start:738 stop:1193 length:456 start_codon:yes stop_codon:yes gene_type:complete
MKKIFLVVIIIFLHGCGFKPIYSSKDSNYKIISIEKNINNNLTQYIQDSINVYSNNNSEKNLKINLNFNEDIVVILKDSKGDPKKNRLTITLVMEIFNQSDNLIETKKFSENFEYNIDDNKFNLKQYEKNIKLNLVNEIIQQILVFLAEVK